MAIPCAPAPTGMGLPGALLPVSIGVTVPPFATYAGGSAASALAAPGPAMPASAAPSAASIGRVDRRDLSLIRLTLSRAGATHGKRVRVTLLDALQPGGCASDAVGSVLGCPKCQTPST